MFPWQSSPVCKIVPDCIGWTASPQQGSEFARLHRSEEEQILTPCCFKPQPLSIASSPATGHTVGAWPTGKTSSDPCCFQATATFSCIAIPFWPCDRRDEFCTLISRLRFSAHINHTVPKMNSGCLHWKGLRLFTLQACMKSHKP